MSSHDQEVKKRRARNDPKDRDYKCPCGKSYLSYPALFTHVKQKHDGKPPGDLIKPKNQNAKRGRPRGNSINTLDNESDNQPSEEFQQRLNNMLQDAEVEHSLQFNHSIDDGNCCNAVFTRFLRHASLPAEKSKILVGFIWLLKKSLEDQHGEEFCQTNDASEIISICNQLVDSKRQQYQEVFPISRELLIDLTKYFFKWLYRTKITNHKLVQGTETSD